MSRDLVSDLLIIDKVCDPIIAKARGYCPHKPHKKQAEFIKLDCIEALYGGAAGGGKSDALLMAALQHVDKPEYSALLLRRTFRDLNQPKAIMDRARSWLINTDAKWNSQAKRWTFPSGATLTFGYLDAEKDKDQYASAEYHFVGFDELTQFPENWYRFMFSRLRKEKDSRIPIRMRGATNPGNIGHAWVRRRFVDEQTREAPFIPALLDDNPFIDQAGYRESLSKLDSITRQQLEKGVWRNDVSGLVYMFDENKNLIIKGVACHHHILGMDYGATRDPVAFSILGWRERDPKCYVLKSYSKAKMIPSEAADEAHKLNEIYRFERMIGDANGLGSGYVSEARRRFRIPVEAARKNDKPGYIKLMNGDLERGLIVLVQDETGPLVKEYSELPWADDGRTEEASGFDNHCADATLYAWRAAQNYMAQIGQQATSTLRGPFTH